MDKEGDRMNKKLTCSVCGGEIQETSKAFCCSNWRRMDGGCCFMIWKDNYGATFDENDAEKLIEGKSVIKYNISKNGSKYPVRYVLDENHKQHFIGLND